MLIRYMIEAVRTGTPENPVYTPAGVWATDGSGRLAIAFVPGHRRAEAVALNVLERVRAGGRALPSGFLEHHIDQLSPYVGVRGPIRTTDAYASVEDCVLRQIAKLKFPAKGGGVVNYPFIFSQG